MGTEKAHDPFLALLDNHHELDELTANNPWNQKVKITHEHDTTPVTSRRGFLSMWGRFPLMTFGGGIFAWWQFITNDPKYGGKRI